MTARRRFARKLSGWVAAALLCLSCRPAPVPPSAGVGVFVPGEQVSLIRLRSTDGRVLVAEVGASAGVPVAGDWDGDGHDTVGYFEPGADSFHLSDDFGDGVPQFSRVLSGWNCAPCLPVAGDWSGRGADGIGLYDPARGLFLLRDRADAGAIHRTVAFGEPGRLQWPVSGRFSDCREDQLALYDPATSTFRIAACRDAPPPSDFVFGSPGGLPVAGRWTAASRGDGVGVFEPATGRFELRSLPQSGAPDLVVQFFRAPGLPIAGRWQFESQ
jgi:hypothetical protein